MLARCAALMLACLLIAGCSTAPLTPAARTAATPVLVGALPRADDEVVARGRPLQPAADLAEIALDEIATAPSIAAAPTPVPPTPAPRSVAGVPVVANDPVALTQQLVTAERAVRDPSVTGDQLAYMGHLQQLIYKRLLDRPDWRDAVFAALPPDIRPAADLNIAATADLRPRSAVRVTSLPAWSILAPAPIDELLRDYHEAEAKYGVPWYYLASINLVETRMGRIHGLSYAGAQGPMQFMPPTWAYYGSGNVNDPHDAILGAANYLRASGAPGNMARAVYAYNHDNSYVDAVLKYAEVMRQNPNAYRGYYGWQVYFITATDEILLPVGWSKN